MSSVGEVVHDAAALADTFRALLASEAARRAPAVAAELGAQRQLAAATAQAAAVVQDVSRWVGHARKVATIADAGVVAFVLLPRLVDGIGNVLQTAGEDLAGLALGVEPLREASAKLGDAVHEAASLIQVGVDVAEGALDFVDPDALRALQQALRDIATEIGAYATAAGKAGDAVARNG